MPETYRANPLLGKVRLLQFCFFMQPAQRSNRAPTQAFAALGLRCLFILQLLVTAQNSTAASVCVGAFAPPAKMTLRNPNDLLKTEFDRSQILAIGVNDHANFEPFDHLAAIITSRGRDPSLKTIVIEDSMERAGLYAELSVREMDFTEFKRRATEVYGMFSAHEEALFNRVLPAVREINKSRAADPLIVVSIDGVNNRAALEVFAAKEDVSKLYITSVERERDTARNFKRLVSDRFPGKKTIVAYQTTHIAKNLSAIGVDKANGGRLTKRSFLGWLSIARTQMKLAEDKVRVVLVDSLGDWSPSGVLNLPASIERPKENAIAFEWNGIDFGIDSFKLGTFLRDYREGSVKVIDPSKPVFDAVILEP